MSKSPLAITKEKFGDKAKLIAAVEALATDELWFKRTRKEEGLEHVSNAKLLRLHATFSLVKEQFGTRDKLVSAILDLEKRAKDDGYKARLTGYPVPRLFDLYKSTKKRKGGAAAPAPAAKAEEKKAAPAKAAAAKPAPAAAAAKPAPAAAKAAKKKSLGSALRRPPETGDRDGQDPEVAQDRPEGWQARRQVAADAA